MNSKQEIVENWLPRYTGVPVENFGKYVLLTNFRDYVYHFAEIMDTEVCGLDRPMQSATKDDISIVNFRDYERDYWTGTVYTTNRRVWEHDEEFKQYLRRIRTTAVDMETATLFSVGFYNRIPTGALLLVSDQPMLPDGIKTEKSD